MNRIILLAIIWAFLSCKGQNEAKVVSSFEFLSDEVLKTKSEEELRLLRNEIFARKGYVFKSKDLNTHFKTKSWYKPNSNIKVTLSDEEKKYIDKVKSIESLGKKTDSCLNYFNEKVKNIYPLIGSENWSLNNFFDNYNEKNYSRLNSITNKEGLSCDGFYAYNINCSTEVENILYTAYCNDNPIFHILSIKGDKIIKKIKVVDSSLREGDGNIVDGFYEIDFKLDDTNLEVYKIYKEQAYKNPETKKDAYKTKEVRREVTKYKLTENGLIEL